MSFVLGEVALSSFTPVRPVRTSFYLWCVPVVRPPPRIRARGEVGLLDAR